MSDRMKERVAEYKLVYLWWLSSKEYTCNAGDLSSIPGSGRSPGEGNDCPLQCSCLENSMDRRAWQAKVHGVTKIWTQLSDSHFLTSRRASWAFSHDSGLASSQGHLDFIPVCVWAGSLNLGGNGGLHE